MKKRDSINTRLLRVLLMSVLAAMLSISIIHAITFSLVLKDFVFLQLILALPLALILTMKFRVIFKDMLGWDEK